MSVNKVVERIVASVKADPLYPGIAAAVVLGFGWYDNKFANPAFELS